MTFRFTDDSSVLRNREVSAENKAAQATLQSYFDYATQTYRSTAPGYADAYNAYRAYLQSQEPRERAVAVIEISGGARLDPRSIKMSKEYVPGDYGPDDLHSRELLSTPAVQLIAISAGPAPIPYYEVRDRNFAATVRNFEMTGTMLGSAIDDENSRTLARMPSILVVRACPGRAGEGFIRRATLLAATDRCLPLNSATFAQTVTLATSGPVRIDYANSAPLTPGEPTWAIGAGLPRLTVSYASLDGEARDSQELFLSAAFIGLATALGPIGLEQMGPWRRRTATDQSTSSANTSLGGETQNIATSANELVQRRPSSKTWGRSYRDGKEFGPS